MACDTETTRQKEMKSTVLSIRSMLSFTLITPEHRPGCKQLVKKSKECTFGSGREAIYLTVPLFGVVDELHVGGGAASDGWPIHAAKRRG
eukprot:2417280-Pleurochrysis_carterae.AAC.1